jgi:hypothetical protein
MRKLAGKLKFLSRPGCPESVAPAEASSAGTLVLKRTRLEDNEESAKLGRPGAEEVSQNGAPDGSKKMRLLGK